MRSPASFIVFLAIALSVYGFLNYYVIRRGWQALTGHRGLRWAWLSIMILLAASFPLGRIFTALKVDGVAAVGLKLGAFSLALWLHLTLIAVLVDLLRLASEFTGVVPSFVAANPQRAAFVAFWAGLVMAGGVILGGFINAGRPRVRPLEVAIDKPAPGLRTLNIAMASDIHLGTVNGCGRLEKIVRMINDLAPEIILLPGDIVDESVSLPDEERMIGLLQRLEAPLGVYSVVGNHEVYSGLEKNLDYLRRGGVRVLQDEAVLVGGSFWLVGRKDPDSVPRGQKRVPLAEIMDRAGVDRARPLILLDHQPVHLEQAAEAGIDLQLSGHTHAGQFFPLNLINKAIWEQYWGSLRKGKTQYYVSCGAGTWGPPIRTGSTPEIIRLKLTFR